MVFRLADSGDLPRIKAVFAEIVETMCRQGLEIWDEVYPCEFFAGDIEKNRLYILEDAGEIAAAFALCDGNPGENAVQWEDKAAKALYLDRLGVNVRYARKGLGGVMLRKAAEAAGGRGAQYLRLFVVDGNRPAMNLYQKNGFRRVEGFYDEVIDDDLVLREFAFEIKTSGGGNF